MLGSPSTQVCFAVYGADHLDGGLKRLRIFGYPIAPATSAASKTTIPALPLTYEAFKPYGQVIQGFGLSTSSPKGVLATIANQGTAAKYHKLARVEQDYDPKELVKGGTSISVVRAEAQKVVGEGLTFDISVMER
jgi:allantoicase